MVSTISKKTAIVRPRTRVVPVHESLKEPYGLDVRPMPDGLWGGVVLAEDVWLETPLDGDPRWLVAHRLVIDGDRAVVAEVRVFPNEPDRILGAGEWSAEWYGRKATTVPPGGLSTRALRSIRLGHDVHSLKTYVDQLQRNEALRPLLDPKDGWFGSYGVTESLRAERVPMLSTVRTSARGRPPLPRLEYARIAEAYAAAVARQSRHPIQDVATHFDLSVSNVRARIHTARRIGFLDRGRQGNAGGQLLPAARRLLRSAGRKRQGKAHGKKTR